MEKGFKKALNKNKTVQHDNDSKIDSAPFFKTINLVIYCFTFIYFFLKLHQIFIRLSQFFDISKQIIFLKNNRRNSLNALL